MKRCMQCRQPDARGSWDLCQECDPAPWWAHFTPLRWAPWVKRRWF